jgi:hypothetical protein
LSDPVPALRRQLAEPRLSFRGRQERDDTDLLALVGDVSVDSPNTAVDQLAGSWAAEEAHWTQLALRELLDRLDGEHRVQAEVIRAAAHQANGRLARALVYEVGEYEDGRTLRGFTRPVNRITRQLQRSGLIAASVAAALEPVYGQDGQVAYFVVPPEVRELLIATKGTPHHYGGGQKKNAIKGSDDFLTRIPGSEYQHALRHIFSTLADLDGLRIFWGTTGCSLRVALPGRGPRSPAVGERQAS